MSNSDVPYSKYKSFAELNRAVQDWASKQAPYSYRYGSPASYYGDALAEGMISQDEYESARIKYGEGWNYAGD